MKKSVYVTFPDKKKEQDFELLKSGSFQDKELYFGIERAIQRMKNNPECGVKMPKKIWPKEYVKKYEITNLWKCNLPKGWRIVYTIKEDEVIILNIILEWFDHKQYERRFRY